MADEPMGGRSQSARPKCWQVKECGREVGGARSAELGVCPAARHEAGDACWLLAGTFCGGIVQGTFAEKLGNCMRCDHYRSFDLDHRTRVRMKFAHLLGVVQGESPDG